MAYIGYIKTGLIIDIIADLFSLLYLVCNGPSWLNVL